MSFCLAAAASPAVNMRPPPDRGSPPAPSPGQAKRRALLLTRKGVPVVLDMKLILSVMRPAPMPGNRTRAIRPVHPLPPFQTNSRRLLSNRWRLFRNRRALRLHFSEQCRPIRRQCGLLHACDKKMAHRPNIAHAFPRLQAKSRRPQSSQLRSPDGLSRLRLSTA